MSSISMPACGMRSCRSLPILSDRNRSPTGRIDSTNAGSKHPEFEPGRFRFAGVASFRCLRYEAVAGNSLRQAFCSPSGSSFYWQWQFTVDDCLRILLCELKTTLCHYVSHFFAVCVAMIGLVVNSHAADAPTQVDTAKLKAATERAAEFLKNAQADDGSFSGKSGPGVTAIVTAGLLRSGRPVDDAVVAKALKYLESNRHEDGGVYQTGSNHKNYETCLAIIAFKEANGTHHYDDLLAAAEKFVKKEQWDEDEGKSEDNAFYGGAGYGGASRPDLSNTGFLLDALHELGRGDDDPAIQKALIFVSRCQNLKSKYNTEPFADKVNDGGFIYSAVEGGQSPAGKTDDGGLSSYGSMTYVGFKSMIYAGVKKDDPRVKAAHEWIQKHYTLDENPGMGAAGLVLLLPHVRQSAGCHRRRQVSSMRRQVAQLAGGIGRQVSCGQKPDGSWVNDNTRWMETDPNLVTAYGLLCLSYCEHKSPPLDHVLSPPPRKRNSVPSSPASLRAFRRACFSSFVSFFAVPCSVFLVGIFAPDPSPCEHLFVELVAPFRDFQLRDCDALRCRL